MKHIEIAIGIDITEACRRLAEAAPAYMDFNGIRVEAKGGETAADLQAAFEAEMDRLSEESARKRDEYLASPEGKRQQAEFAERQKRTEATETENAKEGG
jgi:hypothetical protein